MELKNYYAQDDAGNVIGGALCHLYVRGTESLAKDLKNKNGGALDNPFIADQDGLIQFAAPNGLYDLRVLTGLRDSRIRIQCSDIKETLPVSIKDAPFLAKLDGSDDSAAFERFWNHLKTHGGRGIIPEGTLYSKTFRPNAYITGGSFKSFDVVAAGSGNTVIKYGNIDPVLNESGTAVITREPHLFDIRGLSGLNNAPKIRLKGFTVDYSEQVYKGGASAATPALTDIKPLSKGVNMINASDCDGIDIEDVIGVEIYGNGVMLNRTPFSRVVNCRGFNVSGGNPGLTDSDGGFLTLLRGSQVGTIVDGCIAINTRQYKTDTIGGYIDRSAKDTPCGYIGFWSEFGTNTDGVPLKIAKDLWLDIEGPNAESFGGTIRNCFAYGYTLGFKLEGYAPTTLESNTAIGCWIPFMTSGTRGNVKNCYGDLAGLDGKICPQGGFRYVQGVFTSLNYAVDNPVRYAGVTFDGCIGVVRNTPLFTTNASYYRFLNHQGIIRNVNGKPPNVYNTPSVAFGSGCEITGTLLIDALSVNFNSYMTNAYAFNFDVVVINQADKAIFLNFNAAGAVVPKGQNIRIQSEGLVGVHLINNHNCDLDFQAKCTDISKKFNGTGDGDRFISTTGGCSNTKIRAVIDTHTAICSGAFGLVEVNGKGSKIDLAVYLADAGENTLQAILSLEGENRVDDVRVMGNPYNTPILLSAYGHSFMHVESAEAPAGTPLFAGTNVCAPLTFGPGVRVSKLSAGVITTEPNRRAGMPKNNASKPFLRGTKFPYLLTAANGREGLLLLASGYDCDAWASGAVVAVGSVRANAGSSYVATTAGTTGASGPAHTEGTASDGSVSWAYLGGKARFAEYGSIGEEL